MTQKEKRHILNWIHNIPWIKALDIKISFGKNYYHVQANDPENSKCHPEEADRIIHMLQGAIDYIEYRREK